uniref:Uncharacterized protein n=1 Tax=Lygus hesperus TaxID=30085 RepID=A0A146LYH9_LYGHE
MLRSYPATCVGRVSVPGGVSSNLCATVSSAAISPWRHRCHSPTGSTVSTIPAWCVGWGGAGGYSTPAPLPTGTQVAICTGMGIGQCIRVGQYQLKIVQVTSGWCGCTVLPAVDFGTIGTILIGTNYPRWCVAAPHQVKVRTAPTVSTC